MLLPLRAPTRSICPKLRRHQCQHAPHSLQSHCPGRSLAHHERRGVWHSGAIQHWSVRYSLGQAGGIHTRVQLILVGPLEDPYPRHPIAPPEGEGVWGLDVQGRRHPLNKAIVVAPNRADFPVDAHKGSLLAITPEEQAHAILLKVADDVRQGPRTTNSGGWCSLARQSASMWSCRRIGRSGRPTMPVNSSCNTIGLWREQRSNNATRG